MSALNILLAGFGGQGILFTGKVMAYAGLMEGKEVSWLPSYGPEMRGGTANCSVCISDDKIGSPLVVTPDVLVAMNLPSLEKFEDAVVHAEGFSQDIIGEPVRIAAGSVLGRISAVLCVLAILLSTVFLAAATFRGLALKRGESTLIG